MARFEDAIRWVMNGGRARRKCWANISEYTRATPPISYERKWHIWMPSGDKVNIINGWGGQVGSIIDDTDPIRDGQGFSPTDDDRVADDWELMDSK